MTIQIPPYTLPARVATVQPYIYSDGQNAMLILEELRSRLFSIVGDVNESVTKNDEFFVARVNELIDAVNARIAANDETLDAKIVELVESVNSLHAEQSASFDQTVADINARADAWLATQIENNDIVMDAVLSDETSAASIRILDNQRARTGVYSLTDFGGAADYSAGGTFTDNADALEALIDATPAGGTAMVPPGFIHSSRTIVIDKPINFDCSSSGFDRIHSEGGTQLIFPSGVTGIHVRRPLDGGDSPSGFRIGPFELLSLATGAAEGVGILVTDGMGLIDGVIVNGFGSHGIHMKAGSGAGNVNNSVLNRVRVYGNYGDGIKVEGNDAQMIKILWPDIVGNRGWGLNIEGSATTRCLYPHFDQAYFGSPGAIRDSGHSSTYLDVYCESGGNGSKILLEQDSVYAHITYSEYGRPAVTDLSPGKSAVIDSRWHGRIRHTKLSGAGANPTTMETNVDVFGSGYVTTAITDAQGYKSVNRFNRDGVIWDMSHMSGNDGGADLGAPWGRWRNAYFESWVRFGVREAGTRPDAATAGEGATIYDRTTKKLIASDGTVWRDAMGTAV